MAAVKFQPSSMAAATDSSGAPPAATEQIDIGAHVRERIAGGIDAVHPGNGVKDDFPTVRVLVIGARRQGNCSKQYLLTAGRPRHTRISHVIARLRHLHEHTQPGWSFGQPQPDLVEQEILRLGRRLFAGQVFGPRFGTDAKSTVTADALGIGELERRDGKKCLPHETRWDRLWGFCKTLSR